ncbi:ABC transporter ATP-binding protein [Luteipulveratus mongoliensis]|uniref:ABC transporter n=1 Tax=Luteipulveratus mongoliensis TaxID=571913 RepID=A0A0K1JN54_9MICO|nr:ABC transporter ATP-binding protein [Luteipulveratus mongoliensis]AKU18018.1 ABC transporter [Luteipulveratus mongoliensis]
MSLSLARLRPQRQSAAGPVDPDAAVQLVDVTKTYRSGGGSVAALSSVSLRVPRAKFLAVMGRSGSGKSTLLHCAAGLDVPTSGSVAIGGTEVSRLSETERTLVRRARVGFVFQSYNLVPSLTIEHNITLPLRLAGSPVDHAWLESVVEHVGLSDHLQRMPSELSGGQQQRAAIARALAAGPDVIFADEPTGALDLQTATDVLSLLRDLTSSLSQTVVMVTHDPMAAAWADDTVVMADGRIDQVLREPDAATLAAVLGGYHS